MYTADCWNIVETGMGKPVIIDAAFDRLMIILVTITIAWMDSHTHNTVIYTVRLIQNPIQMPLQLQLQLQLKLQSSFII